MHISAKIVIYFPQREVVTQKPSVATPLPTDIYIFFFETDADIFNFSRMFAQLSIFDWLPISIFQNLFTDILPIFKQIILVKVRVGLHTAPTYGNLINEVD